MLSPCITSSGPCPAPLMIVGEAPGEQEEMLGLPFVGSSGQELTLMLREAGLERSEAYLTNVFWTRPPGNKVQAFFAKKNEGGHALLPPLAPGRYILPEFLPELERLAKEIREVNPTLILAMGNTAAWALLHSTKISSIRGTVSACAIAPAFKVLPTYHPANVLRQWENRPIVIADLMKAKHELGFKEIRRPLRRVTINPTIEEVEAFVQEAALAKLLAVDVETKRRQITVCGFATSPSRAFVIPFISMLQPGHNYWPTLELEVRAFQAMRSILLNSVPKVLQNGLYDIQYFWRYGIPVPTFQHDLMIRHHSLFPELPKGLGFLGSIYTNEASWKLLRPRGDDMNRREE